MLPSKSTPQTRYLQNVAYIRLKNLQFGYTLPQPIVSKAKIAECTGLYFGRESLVLVPALQAYA